MEFCFLKGLVECNSGRVQDCNIKRTQKCPLDEDKQERKNKKQSAKTPPKKEAGEDASKLTSQEEKENQFCFLKGIVECNSGRIQDCNMKRMRRCPLEEDAQTAAKKEKPAQSVKKEDADKSLSKKETGADASKLTSQEEKENQFCFLKGIVECNSGRIQDCNMKRMRRCPLEEDAQTAAKKAKPVQSAKQEDADKSLSKDETGEDASKLTSQEEKENQFCFLKGIVECNSGRIQDCNMKRMRKCPLEDETQKAATKENSANAMKKKEAGEDASKLISQEEKENQFCFLKGIVECNSGRIQDCNMKRMRKCPLD